MRISRADVSLGMHICMGPHRNYLLRNTNAKQGRSHLSSPIILEFKHVCMCNSFSIHWAREHYGSDISLAQLLFRWCSRSPWNSCPGIFQGAECIYATCVSYTSIESLPLMGTRNVTDPDDFKNCQRKKREMNKETIDHWMDWDVWENTALLCDGGDYLLFLKITRIARITERTNT